MRAAPALDFGGGSESTNGWNRKKEESSDFGCEGRNLQGSSGRKEGGKKSGYCMRDREMGRKRVLMPECIESSLLVTGG